MATWATTSNPWQVPLEPFRKMADVVVRSVTCGSLTAGIRLVRSAMPASL
jgi:hypothetical protein